MGIILNRRRVMGKLPSSYTKLEWIENTSNAYINTGVVAQNVNYLYFKYQFEINASAYSMLMGARNGSSDGGSIQFRYNSGSYIFGRLYNIKANDLLPHTVEAVWDWYNGKVVIDGVTNVVQFFGNRDCYIELPLFGFRSSDGAVPSPAKGKIYECILNDTEFTPCLDNNNVAGIYNSTTNEFLQSPNGTPFIAGPKI